MTASCWRQIVRNNKQPDQCFPLNLLHFTCRIMYIIVGNCATMILPEHTAKLYVFGKILVQFCIRIVLALAFVIVFVLAFVTQFAFEFGHILMWQQSS